MEALAKRVRGIHLSRFGAEPEFVAFAPGRVEVLGNHTDYNGGTALAFAIKAGIGFCLTPSKGKGKGIRVFAADVNESTTIPLPILRETGGSGWVGYIKGVVFHLISRGLHLDGVDCTFAGSLPMGAGLSSSAALEVAAATGIVRYLGGTISPTDTAVLCRDAEREFVGNNCGLMDQLTSIHGRDNALLHLDFEDSSVRPVELPAHAKFIVVDTGTKHELVESEYNERRDACKQAAQNFSRMTGREVPTLRHVSLGDLREHGRNLSDPQAGCANHIVGEIHRVRLGLECMGRGDLYGFGKLMFASHESSKTEFKNSCRELDVAVDIAAKAGAHGARLTGGGFGGSVLVLTNEDQAPSVAKTIEENLDSVGVEGSVSTIVPSAGARFDG